MKYDYNTFKELFDAEIQYAYEGQYGVHIGTNVYHPHNKGEKVEYITFYKLTIFSDGTLEYKGHYQTYNPRLWKKIKQFAKMLIETKAEKVLYGLKKEKAPEPED